MVIFRFYVHYSFMNKKENFENPELKSTVFFDYAITEEESDQFQRYEFAKRIASIASTPSLDKSLTIGLYGKWGEGKSTVLNFIDQELDPEIVSIHFNPWYFSNQEQLLVAFLNTLAEKLCISLKGNKAKIAEVISDYAFLIKSVGELNDLPIGSTVDGVQKIANRLAHVSIKKQKEKLDEMISKSNINIVVFIDDIDRLDLTELQYVFKLVKLVGDFPKTKYILAFDDQMVTKALTSLYSGNGHYEGYNFLEKIIQVPILIPKASPKALKEYCLGLIQRCLENHQIKLSDVEFAEYIDVFDTSFLPLLDNPRICIRYANAVNFSISLLKGEVFYVDLLIVEGCKAFYPELYSIIRGNRRLFLGLDVFGKKILNEKEVNTEIGNLLEPHYNNRKIGFIKEIFLYLFPSIGRHLKGSSSALYAFSSDNWQNDSIRDKRISSQKHFDRYFSFSVQKDEISELDFEEFLEITKCETPESISQMIKQIMNTYSSFDFLQMTRVRMDEFSNDQMINLSKGISMSGSSFSIEDLITISSTSAQIQSIRIVTKLLRRIDFDDKFSFARNLIDIAETPDYTVRLAEWVTLYDRESEPNKLFSLEEENELKKMALKRYHNEVSKKNFFELLSYDSFRLVREWYKTFPEENLIMKSHLNEYILDSKYALKLLKFFVPTVTVNSTKGGAYKSQRREFKSNFSVQIFESIKVMVDPEVLNRSLVQTFGFSPYEEDLDNVSNVYSIELDDKTMVSVFQRYFNDDTIEKNEQ